MPPLLKAGRRPLQDGNLMVLAGFIIYLEKTSVEPIKLRI
jgi:hypothetical protein